MGWCWTYSGICELAAVAKKWWLADVNDDLGWLLYTLELVDIRELDDEEAFEVSEPETAKWCRIVGPPTVPAPPDVCPIWLIDSNFDLRSFRLFVEWAYPFVVASDAASPLPDVDTSLTWWIWTELELELWICCASWVSLLLPPPAMTQIADFRFGAAISTVPPRIDADADDDESLMWCWWWWCMTLGFAAVSSINGCSHFVVFVL